MAFSAKLKNGNRSSDWSDEGVDPTASKENVPMNLEVSLNLNGTLYTATVTVQYSSRAGVGGKFKK